MLTSRCSLQRHRPAYHHGSMHKTAHYATLRTVWRARTAFTPSVSAADTLSSASQESLSSTDGEVRVPWHKRPCEWLEVGSTQELLDAVSAEHNSGRLTVVDFYAGWCASCKSAFPALCKVPKLPSLAGRYNFYKANIESGDLTAFVKKRALRGIPWVIVYDATGKEVLSMSASFKRMEQLRRGLDHIARTAEKGGKLDFVLDPNGYVVDR